jgi:Cu/Ag efflux protein CusF
MEAMTMEFPVKDPEQYAKLAVGDRVNATLYVNDLEYYLAKVEVTGRSAR